MTVDTYVSYAFFIAMAAPLVFVIIYLTMPWWKTLEGRIIMAQKLLFVGFLFNGVLYFALGPDYAARDLIRVVLFTAMPVVLWGMTLLLIRAKLESRRMRKQAAAEGAQAARGDTDPELETVK